MATQYDPIAKDESLNTTENPSRNIADVLAEGLDDIVSALGGGSLEDLNDVAIVTPSNGQTLKYNSTTQKWENANDAGGHTIYDPDETAMTQRAGLGFADAHVSDNSGDDRTDVSLVQRITDANWALLDPTDESNNGFYQIGNSPLLHLGYVGNGEKKDLDAGAQSDYVEVVADGVKTTSTLFDELYALVDRSRVNVNTVLQYEASGTMYSVKMTAITSTAILFGTNCIATQANNQSIQIIYVFKSSGSLSEVLRISQSSPYIEYLVQSTDTPASGTIYRIYYNDAHTFDFNTKAENCIFDPTGTSLSSTNAEDAIKEVDGKIDKGSVSVTADGVKTNATLLNELYALFDWTKVTKDSKIVRYRSADIAVYNIRVANSTNGLYDNCGVTNTNTTYIEEVRISASSTIHFMNGTTHTDASSSVQSAGTVFTLYY